MTQSNEQKEKLVNSLRSIARNANNAADLAHSDDESDQMDMEILLHRIVAELTKVNNLWLAMSPEESVAEAQTIRGTQMKLSEMLKSMASQIESPENEAIVSEETALACIKAASELNKVADTISLFEKTKLVVAEVKQLLEALAATSFNQNELDIELFDGGDFLGEVVASPEIALAKINEVELPEDITATVSVSSFVGGLDEAAKMATLLDKVGLIKQASVIDELLLGVGANPNAVANFKAAQQKKIDEIKQKYQQPNEYLHEIIGVEDAKKAIEKSEYMKERRPLEMSLSTRVCPDHFAPMARVAEDTYQCPLDKKVYDYRLGFSDEKGNKRPAGNVSEQTKFDNFAPHQIFDSREGRLQSK